MILDDLKVCPHVLLMLRFLWVLRAFFAGVHLLEKKMTKALPKGGSNWSQRFELGTPMPFFDHRDGFSHLHATHGYSWTIRSSYLIDAN